MLYPYHSAALLLSMRNKKTHSCMYAYCFDKTPHSQDWTKRKLIVINWENINLNSQVLRSSFVTFSHKLEGKIGGF